MEGRRFLILAAAGLLAVPAVARSPLRLAPVLPEVTKNLEDARADVKASTFPLARAHAKLVLLDSIVQYSVSFEGVPESHQKECLGSLAYAMQEWQKDLDQKVVFERLSGKQKADVVVRFRPNVTMNKEQVAGYVNWARSVETEPDGSFKPIFKADLQLRVKDLEGRNMPQEAVRHAAMHELGHVLGLDDSPREGDVMGPLNIDNPVSAPTQIEIDTVKKFRAEAGEILQQAGGADTGIATR